MSELISIHSPHAGRDCMTSGARIAWMAFQSTLPMRGETSESGSYYPANKFQSTLPMRGETKLEL